LLQDIFLSLPIPAILTPAQQKPSALSCFKSVAPPSIQPAAHAAFRHIYYYKYMYHILQIDYASCLCYNETQEKFYSTGVLMVFEEGTIRMKKAKILKRTFSFLAVALLSLTLLSVTAHADYYTDTVTLSYGIRTSEVKNLQNDLKSLGYFKATSTGYFGSITKSAVISYQKANGLTADGIVGKKTSRSIKVNRIVQIAKSCLGDPYVWGGTTTSGFDCSGFTQYVFKNARVSILRTAAQQYTQGTWISKSNLKVGDLVFFTTYAAGASHVGIYLGNDQFIHASSGAGKIVISSLFSNSYYSSHYIGAKRILP
jgi:cell wall-associated NlpC family hydrolase